MKINLVRSPDFKLCGLQIWVFGREFEEARDYHDGNWLRVHAHCGANGASVDVDGPILQTIDLQRWRRELQSCHDSLNGTAALASDEPNLAAIVELTSGKGELRVSITADHLAQNHRFSFEVDQAYLPPLIASLEKLLEKYPVRGEPNC